MSTLQDTIRILLAGAALTLPTVILPPAMSGEDREDEQAASDAAVSRDSEPRTQTASDGMRASDQIELPDVSRVLYRPPRNGSPTPDHRIGGGTRGGNPLPLVAAIAPNHEGLTAYRQPELCWYVSVGDRDLPVVFTLIRSDAIRPQIERRLTPPDRPGIQVIRLSDYDVELEVGHRYEWSVSVVPDPEHRSRDVVATGMIRRIAPPSQTVTQALAGSDPMHALRISASAGLWYDAVGVLAGMIEAAPGDGSLKREWAGLLQQGNLSDPLLLSAKGL